MEFRHDGSLEYVIHAKGKQQTIFLKYRVEGNVLVTDQPSRPREERTEFRLTPDGKLVLNYDNRVSVHVRASISQGVRRLQ
jgi:hypothetical protein